MESLRLSLCVLAAAATANRAAAQSGAADEGQCAARPAVEAESKPGADLAAVRALLEHAESCRDARRLDDVLQRLVPILYARDAPAEAWYLTGRARFALARLGVIARARAHQAVGASYTESAIAALRRALSIDPGHGRSAALLADPTLRRMASRDAERDADAIRAASNATPHDTRLLLARAALELEIGRADDVLELTTRVLAEGGDSGLAHLHRARALFLSNRIDDGYAAWIEGLRLARSDSGRAAYRADIAWVASERELSAFDFLAVSALPGWADDFWRRRAAADFRTAAERVAEHERRIRFALSEFPLRSVEREYNKAMPYRSGQSLTDDRGVVYVRHGAPSRIFRTGTETVQGCPVYSWLYGNGPDRGLTAHFRPFFSLMISDIRFCAASDFKLVPGGSWIDGNAAQLAKYDSLYAEWMDVRRRPVQSDRLARAIAAEEVDRLTLAVTTDAQPHPFARDLDAVVRAYGLGNPARLLVAFGVPHEGLATIEFGDRRAYPIRFRVAAIPRGGGEPVEVDTTFMFDASRALRRNQWIVGYIDIPAPAGVFEVRSLIVGADPLAGSFGLQLPVVVPASSPGEPSVSALVLGTMESELRWPKPGGEFPLSPLNAYSRRTPIEVLLEAEGFTESADVAVELRLVPEVNPEIGAIRLHFTERATGGRLVLRQSIGLSEAPPGFYVLTVAVTPAAGRTVTHSQRLAINP